MSDILDYIFRALESDFTKLKTLSRTEVNTLTLYQHSSGKKLILIESGYRNDDTFIRLKGYDTKGYMPRILEVVSEENKLYVLEEYIDGTPLSAVTQEGKTLDIATLKQYLLDICTALQMLHSLDIVHRDIKPENIMIRNQHAVLIDFGVARITRLNTKDTMNLGTAGYAAPEQYGISQSMPSADIYALGVMANILSTGEHPTKIIPEGRLGRIIKKCTNIQISQRYSTVDELKADIMRL